VSEGFGGEGSKDGEEARTSVRDSCIWVELLE